MQKIALDKAGVKMIFRRNLRCKTLDNSLLDSIADAMGEVIEENNKRLMEELKNKS